MLPLTKVLDLLDEKRRNTVVQFIRFCLVGGSGMVVDMGVTAFASEVLGADPRLGALFGFSLAVISNYLLNRIWTFSGDGKPSHAFSFVTFLAISSIGMAISIGVMHVAMTQLGMGEGLWYLMARFIGIVVATAWNFTGSKLIAFKS